MNKIKVQFIGIEDIPSKKDDEILRVRKVKWDENGYSNDEFLSFHDYHIVFINYPGVHPYPSNEFFDYIEAGGIVVIFLGPSISYPWNKQFLIVSTSSGESINPNPKNWLKNILRKHHFNWSCLLKPGEILNNLQSLQMVSQLLTRQHGGNYGVFEIAGTTISGKCVSSVIHYYGGKLILLPTPKKMNKDLIRNLLDGIKKNYLMKQEIPELKPTWIEKWTLDPEIELGNKVNKIAKDFEKLTEKIEGYESIKKILYTHGNELTLSIYLIFKEMGFDVVLKENEGRQDIEIKYNSFFAIIEAKGLKKYANNSDLRQLLDYYVTTSENNPEVKSIFIVNHFRDQDPAERGEPFTQGAIDLAKNNGFCLLTTIDLFKLYDQFLKNEMTITHIIDILRNTKGLHLSY